MRTGADKRLPPPPDPWGNVVLIVVATLMALAIVWAWMVAG